jgi:zeta-carotene desaturase
MIIGGGLAGLSAAAALGSLGFAVDLHEARPFLGGRATSFPLHPSDPGGERIDNCQHVLLRCFTNLLDFYRRVGVADKIRFYEELYFVQPGGCVDVLKRGMLPAPLHLLGSLWGFSALSAADKWSVTRTLLALTREKGRADLDQLRMGDWLASKGTTAAVLERFWRPILVSALNEEPALASARGAFQVFTEGLLAARNSFEIGVPSVPLADLYSPALDQGLGPNVRVHLRSQIGRWQPADKRADFFLVTVPPGKLDDVIPGLDLPLERFEHSPITGIHLWFDRPLTELPHAVLLDRTLQWLFCKPGNYVQAVVSASRSLMAKSREEIVALSLEDLGDFFPAARAAQLLRSHVIKEARATFSAVPGLESIRPGPATRFPNLFLAGDWTDTGWPPTMEGAVRSGYRAAEAVAQRAGVEAGFVLP